MRKLLLAAAASLAAIALPAAPASADHRDGVRVGVHVGVGSHWGALGPRWGHPRWRGHWRDDWRRHRFGPPPRRWHRRHFGWSRPCHRWWWDGFTWRCRW
jgi:hypothetical protein